jgi:transposase
MAKRNVASTAPAFAGIDVGAYELVLALRLDGQPQDAVVFPNDPRGIRRLVRRLRELKRPVFACMEATGVYYEQAARALHAARDISVMVANPRVIKDYAGATNRRSKTDKVDAAVIALFAEKAEFKAWAPAPAGYYQLRQITRRISERVRERAAEKNRLHALQAGGDCPLCVERDVRAHLKVLEQSIARLRREALAVIKEDAVLWQRYQLLRSMPGVGEITAVYALGETCTLPPDMTARQWTAYAGLDPVHKESGVSVRAPARISRAGNHRLRGALFFAAMVAARTDPHVRAFAEKLVRKGKKKMQALVAVMRKLLHAIWGMFKNSSNFNGAILFPNLLPNP